MFKTELPLRRHYDAEAAARRKVETLAKELLKERRWK